MEVLDFTSKEFQEIPMQDNPALNREHPNCLMVYKKEIARADMYAVSKIEPAHNIEAVTRVAFFYSPEHAMLFASEYSKIALF